MKLVRFRRRLRPAVVCMLFACPLPLAVSNAEHLMCYAQRYPDLLERYCHGQASQCDHRRHAHLTLHAPSLSTRAAM